MQHRNSYRNSPFFYSKTHRSRYGNVAIVINGHPPKDGILWILPTSIWGHVWLSPIYIVITTGIYIYIYTLSLYIYVYVYIYTHICICNIYTYVYVTYIYIYTHVCIYIYVIIYIYIICIYTYWVGSQSPHPTQHHQGTPVSVSTKRRFGGGVPDVPDVAWTPSHWTNVIGLWYPLV